MTIAWQDIVTAGLVLAAVVYLGRRVVRLIRRKGFPGCGCCPACPAEKHEEPLVQIDPRRK
jgi:hypothetical protein